jgi:hypothetical protein
VAAAPTAGEVVPAECKFDVADCNVMVLLPKAKPGEWAALEAPTASPARAAGKGSANKLPRAQPGLAAGSVCVVDESSPSPRSDAAKPAGDGADPQAPIEKLLFELD